MGAGWLLEGVLCSPVCTAGWDGSIRPGGGSWGVGAKSRETLPPLGPPPSPPPPSEMWGLGGSPSTRSPADLCGQRGHRSLLRGQKAAWYVGLVGDGGGAWGEVTQR